MENERFEAVMNPFSEYALLVESDEYPKTEVSWFQLKGKVDPGAFAQAYHEAVQKVPLFSCHMDLRREGIFHIPYWVYDNEVPNQMSVVDCRHLVTEPYDLVQFTEEYFSGIIRRRLDLQREFPFNAMLLQVQDETWILALVFHHSVLDPFKAFTVLTSMFARYDELITGKCPEWAETESVGSVARLKKPTLVKPLPFGEFAKEQLTDVWIKNRNGKISPIATKRVADYRQVKGRYSLLKRVDDPKMIQALVDRAINAGCTFNDLILAVTRQTLSQWNQERNASDDRFRMMIATGLIGRMKLPENSGAGLAALNSVSVGHGDSDLDTIMRFFRGQRVSQLTRGIDVRFFITLTKLVGALRVLPLHWRTSLLRPAIQSIPVTFAVSNIGSVWPKKIHADGRQSLESRIVKVGDCKIDALHSSISISRNLEMLVTIRTHHKRLFLCFVCDRFRFTREEAVELTDRIFDNLIGSI
jgi:Condensation domain